jgi:hypothetical protein
LVSEKRKEKEKNERNLETPKHNVSQGHGDERSDLLEVTFNDKVQMVSEIHRGKTGFNYVSIKRALKIRQCKTYI